MTRIFSKSNRSSIYQDELQPNVVWKVGVPGQPSKQLESEFLILSSLRHFQIQKAISKVEDSQLTYGYEFFDGIPLNEWIQSDQDDLDLLDVCIKLLHTLRFLESKRLLHNALIPSHILINELKEIRLVDFSQASTIGDIRIMENLHSELKLPPELVQNKFLKGNISTDIFGFGRLLSNVLAHPHYGEELSTNKKSGLYRILSDLVIKTTSENTSERYHSYEGIIYDLEKCKKELHDNGSINIFQLGKSDISHKIDFSNDLISRKNVLTKLGEILKNCTNGSKYVVQVTGAFGTGKSRVVGRFLKNINDPNIIKLNGSFSQSGSRNPKAGFIQALKQFSRKILSSEQNVVDAWKINLSETLNSTGNVLTRWVPDLNLLRTEKAISKTVNINFPFVQLVKKIPSIHNPLILVLDNIHVADADSLNSIIALIESQDVKFFMLILISDNDRITPGSKFEDYYRKNYHNEDLVLDSFNQNEILDYLNSKENITDASSLAKLVYINTQGHPRSVNYFLEMLVLENIIKYDKQSSSYIWEESDIPIYSEANRLSRFKEYNWNGLSSINKELLKACAVLGLEFEIGRLALLFPADVLNEFSKRMIAENILFQDGENHYRFINNDLVDFVLDQTKKSEKESLHHRFASEKWKKFSNKGDISIFDIAFHLNNCSEIKLREERDLAIAINTLAGNEAINTAAFDKAFFHFSKAIDFVPDDYHENNYEEFLSLYRSGALSASITSDVDKMNRWLEILLINSKTLKDRVSAYEIKLDHLTKNHQFPETVNLLLKVLKEIGYPIKRNPSKFAILKEFIQVNLRLRNKHPHSLLDLPLMEDEKAKAFMRLTVNAATSIFGNAPDILPIVFFRQVRLSLKYGNSKYSPFAYVSFGFAISVFLNQLSKGYNFGTMAMKLVDKLNADDVRNRVLVTFYAFLSGWKENLRASIDPLDRAFDLGQKRGDYLYTGFASYFNTGIRFFSGDNLNVIVDKMTTDNAFILRMKQDFIYWICESQRQMALNFIHEKEDPTVLDQNGFNEDEFFRRLEEFEDEASKFDFYASKLYLACYFNQYEKAFLLEEQSGKFEEETTSRQINFPAFLFTSVLAITKHIELHPKSKNKKLLKRLNKKIKLLKIISESAPINYENKYLLAQAWMMELNANFDGAEKLYISSISKSKAAFLIHEESLAREHLAFLYKKQNKPEFAELMFEKAYLGYNLWGADAKCRQMEKSLSHDVEFARKKEKLRTSSSSQDNLNLELILSTHKVLADQETLEDLLNKALEIILKNARITKVIVFLANESNALYPKALGTQQFVNYSLDDQNKIDYPKSLINYIARVKKKVVSDNVRKDMEFTFDPYWNESSNISVCAIPLMSKQEFVGAIYFENEILENAFNEERVEFFETISAQLNTSLENLLLYSQLEEQVVKRTSQLQQKNEALTAEKEKSDNLIKNILPSDTAEDLKNLGRTTAKRHNHVSVLFLDIVNFTLLAEHLEPELLLEELNNCFRKFDQICLDFQLEKIKTIGDAYMAASGFDDNDLNHVNRIVQAALAMKTFVLGYTITQQTEVELPLDVRIGIHQGPVVAGVVGLNKFQYDIWGDTVNIAARLQQHADPNQINVSQEIYQLIKEQFECEYRGKVPIKNKGEMDMYLVLK